jgi:hypothetical protein
LPPALAGPQQGRCRGTKSPQWWEAFSIPTGPRGGGPSASPRCYQGPPQRVGSVSLRASLTSLADSDNGLQQAVSQYPYVTSGLPLRERHARPERWRRCPARI